jgi:capsular polysaccharide biosynthesis protein
MKSADNRFVTASSGIYGWLLALYPAQHRQKFGGQMEQLFRDQCRDAWQAGGVWSLAILWLRVLPDLAKTSVLERLASLRGEQSMWQAILNFPQLPHAPRMVFVAVAVTLFGLTTVATLLLPTTYVSTARVTLAADGFRFTSRDGQPLDADSVMMKNFIGTQIAIMQSEAVLVPVIRDLNLQKLWGLKYAAGQSLGLDQSLTLLRHKLNLQPVPQTQIISITVYDEDNQEGVRIANKIAESYQAIKGQMVNSGSSGVEIVESAVPSTHAVRPNIQRNLVSGAIGGCLLGGLLAGIVYRLGRSRNAPPRGTVITTADKVVGALWAFVGGLIFGLGIYRLALNWCVDPDFGFDSNFLVTALLSSFFGEASYCGFQLRRGRSWPRVPLGVLSAVMAAEFIISGGVSFRASLLHVSQDLSILFWLASAVILLRPRRGKTGPESVGAASLR